MAHAPPALPAGPVRPTLVHYRDLFADASTDVFNGRYADAMAPYNIPAGAAATHSPQECRRLMFDARAQGVPTALLLQHNDDNKLHIYLQVDHVTTRLGMAATGWEDRTFLGKGDLHHNQHVLVEFENDYWNRTAVYYSGNDAAIDNGLTADPNAQALGPWTAADAGAIQIRSRSTVFVPPSYVNLFLAAPLTPRQAWETVRAQIVADGREADCAPLITYLRLALTIEHVGDTESPLAINPPTVPLADVFLLDRRRKIVEADFPSLNDALVGVQQNQIAAELHTLVTATQTAQADANNRRLAAQTKSPTDLFGASGSLILLRLSNQQRLADVEEFWKLLANNKKSQHLGVLQWEVNQVKELLGEIDLSFSVDGAVLEAMKNLNWPMASNDAVETGFSAWLLPESKLTSASTAQSVYEMLYGDGASPSLADATALVRAKPGAPRQLYQVRLQIRKFHILNVVALGIAHPLCQAINAYHRRFLTMESTLHALHAEDLLLPTKLLKRFCVQISQWYRRQGQQANIIAPPSLESVFDDVECERPWAPLLSLPFLQSLGLQNFHRPANPFRPGAVGDGNNGGAAPGGGGDDRLAGAARVPNERMNNTAFADTLFSTYKAMPVSCRTLRQKINRNELPALPLSKVDRQPMCLAWHTKGLCNVACSRGADHVAYTTAEYQPLLQWCTTNFHE